MLLSSALCGTVCHALQGDSNFPVCVTTQMIAIKQTHVMIPWMKSPETGG